MSFLRCLVAVSGGLALAACGSNSSGDDASTPDSHTGSPDAHTGPDATPGPDAMPSAYACVGQAFPTNAPDPLTIMGVTKEINQSGQVVLGAVTVAAFDASDNSLASQTSDATTGAYTLSVASGGTPINGYLHGTKTGGTTPYKDTYVYADAPLAVNQPYVPVLMVSNLTWAFLPALSHGAMQPAGSGFLGVLVVDCDGAPVAGATVTADSGTVRYVSGSGIGDPAGNPPVTATDASGIALIFDVTPGDTVHVSGSGGGHTFLQHAIKVRADVVTTTVVAPGPISGLAP